MRRSTSTRLAAAITAASLLPPCVSQAQGQDSAPAAAPGRNSQATSPLEEIVVTGSLIKRTEVSSQLVTAIAAEEIARRGATNATDILSAVAQNQPIEVPNSFMAAGTGLASYASLRSLGSESTLVLFNGRRIVNNPYKNKAVDLNTVPIALIDRVDVLSDGASSIYGSDAIAGVINFITHDEMQGVRLSANTLQPEEPGGEAYSGSATVGFGSLAHDGWNFYAGGMWRKRKELRMIDRDFADTSYIPARGVDRTAAQTFPANVYQVDGTTGDLILDLTSPFPDCAPPLSIPVDGLCVNDNAVDNVMQNPEEQRSLITKLTGRLGAHTASIEYFYAQSQIDSSITPVAISDIEMAPSNPYYPGNGITPAIPGLDTTQSLFFEARIPAAGRRTAQSFSYTDRALAELKGDVAGWDYELWALQSRSKVKVRATGTGILLQDPFLDGLAGANGAPLINPFGEQTPQALQYLQDIQFKGTLQSATGELAMAGFQVSNKLFALPGGMVSTALAFEYGHETVAFSNSPAGALVVGFVGPGSDVSAARDRYSVTGEVLIPLFRRFEVDGSLRLDHYSDFGSAVNPKILATYEVVDSVLSVHGSFNTGFRAPTLYELHAPLELGQTLTRQDDPFLCPGGVVNTAAGGFAVRDCNAQYSTLEGSNPDLDAVESKAFALGFDWTPLEGLSLGFDYWNYTVDKSVGTLADVAIFHDLDRYGNLIVRCSQSDPRFRFDAGCNEDGTPMAGQGDPIAYLVERLSNIGQTKTTGFDFGVNWSKEFALGTLALDYRGTYIEQYEFQQIPGDPFVSRVGIYLDGAPIFRYSHYTTLSWSRGAWDAQLQNRLSSGYIDFNNGNGADRTYEFYNEVSAYSLWNLSLTYKHGEAWTVTALVKNLFNTDPPFTNKLAGLGTGFDERFTDSTLRAFALTISARFGGPSD